ncbi:MAG: UDP-3-O-acylglucosamine N-acyltransferase [Candidatus Angelobacter sp.]|nr:UDP-3-O-acylglucosamine N-acyltransferase [Candidatus Angelobacter sp.]
MGYSLQEIANNIGGRVVRGEGDPSDISGVASIASAGPHDLVFIEDEKMLSAALQSKAAGIIAPESLAEELSKSPKQILFCAQPKLAFARAAKFVTEQRMQDQQLGVHPSAIVHQDAKIGLGASIGPHSVIHARAEIGARTRIASGVTIGVGVSIGKEGMIHANVSIYPGTRLGDRVIIHAGAVLGSDGFGYVRDNASGTYEKFPQIGRLEIHDDVEIGANSTIDRGALDATVIGRGTKLDNLVHIGHNVQVGENVVIAAQTGISGSCVIEDAAIIGGQVGLGDHVTIGTGVILGSKSGVLTGKIVRGKGEVYWGVPARPLKQHLKELAALSRLAKSQAEEK